jgi:hypothetical protein
LGAASALSGVVAGRTFIDAAPSCCYPPLAT